MTNFLLFQSQEEKSWSVPSDSELKKITLLYFQSNETIFAIHMSNFL